jgi:DNA/RNA endonuclease YhcR with UshA esterase domain
LPHKPAEGSISPRDALKKIGQKVVIEMKVQATGQPKGGGRLFLNSEKDFRSDLNFTVVLNAGALKGKWAKESFKEKVIRVSGTVSEFRGTPQVQVDDEKQIEIVE